MTKVDCYIKYSPYTITVSNAVLNRLDLWKRSTDGIGRFQVTLKNDAGEWLNQFLADDPIQINILNVNFLKGYLDKGFPYSQAEKSVYEQYYQLIGRDYGQDLQNKLVNKTGNWAYKTQPADDIIEDMLIKAGSEITFVSSHTAPQIPYTEGGDEYLIEAFRKIAEKVNYDLHVDVTKTLKFFPIGTLSSGITLKCVAGASDNNILRLEKTEFDAYDLKNYIMVKGREIDDGYSDCNASDFTGGAGNVISNEFVIVKKGAGSIKCALGGGDHCEINLTFPKYNYDYLPADIFGEESLAVWLRADIPGTPWYWPRVYIQLEDTEGHKIQWNVSAPAVDNMPRDKWVQFAVPIGTEYQIKKWKGGNWSKGEWRVASDYDPALFNWKIKEITAWAKTYSYGQVANLYLDGLKLPFNMVAYVQDATSEGLYKVRHYPVLATDIKTQWELNEFANSQKDKRGAPIQGLKVWAMGIAGIAIEPPYDRWIPGCNVTVNSPGDGINNQTYRILDAHLILSEMPIMNGHDFVVEVDLIPYDAKVSGLRLSYVKDPEIALIRGLNDRMRFIEKTEELKYDYFPPLPANIAEKIKVGEFASLSETIIEWSRQWFCENFSNKSADGSVVDDSDAKSGKAFKMPSTAPNQFNWLNSGPCEIPPGEYYLVFRMKVASNASSSKICRVCLFSATQGFDFGTRNIYPADFPNNMRYHYFAVKVLIPANYNDIEIIHTDWATGITDLYSDWVGLVPASVPLGYTDVSILGGTQSTTAQDATQGTSALPATQNTTANVGYGLVTTPLNLDWGSYTTLSTSDWTTVRQGSFNKSINYAEWGWIYAECEREAGSARKSCQIRVKVNDGYYDYYYYGSSHDCADEIKLWGISIPIWGLFADRNQTIYLQVRREGSADTVQVRGKIKIYVHNTHNHGLINPSHDTGINNPPHATGIVNPEHGHGTTDPAHEH